MKCMKKVTRKLVTVFSALAMLFSMPSLQSAVFDSNLEQVYAAESVTRQSIHDGAILHAFCWNFNTIKENMADIASAGYTAVQTSPINECLSTEPGLTWMSDEGKWYYHYQPTDWTIGNYQLGTRDEFIAMCDEADKYGIGIIVDILPNHTTPTFSEISENLLNAVGATYDDMTNLYHIDGADLSRGMNYDDRISTVYDPMGGLPDVDTENHDFQQYFFDFLKDCIDCGADGFRIDTAKHIALPDDGVPEAYAGEEDRNDFYPNMKSYIDDLSNVDYSDLFVYGEVLQGSTSRLGAYQQMLGGTTASGYGSKIRTAVSSGSLSASKIASYAIDSEEGATADKLVTWVESHDNYINDKSYNILDDNGVVLAWAIITARAEGTPLFFARPEGSSKENPYGINVIGDPASDLYKDPQVVAVNKFRTEMTGENEYLRNPSNNNSVLMIERGDKGLVIVNDSEDEFSLESETNLADGTYIDAVEGSDSLYTVENGIISGKVAAKSVVVLDEPAQGQYSTLFYFNSKEWKSVTAIVDGTSYSGSNTGDGWYRFTIPSQEFKVEFTDGTENSSKFSITADSGRYMTGENKKIYSSKEDAEEAIGVITKSVYFLNSRDWSVVRAYAWKEDGTQIFGGWPGLSAKNEGDYWWRADVKMVKDEDFSIIFNNGSEQTVNIDMSDMSENYIAIPGAKTDGNFDVVKYSTKSAAEAELGISKDSTTVYFYNTDGWDEVCAYTWDAADLGEWPGKSAESDGDDWWKITIPASPGDNFNLIFNNNNNGKQTADLKITSLKNLYIWHSKAYASKAEAEAAYKASLEKPSEEYEEKEGYTTVYFYDEYGWTKPCVYAWGGNYNNCIGDWPGTEMTYIGNNWYAANVLTEALENTELHLIFNDDGNNQLEDNVVTDIEALYFTSSSTEGYHSKDDVYKFLNIEAPSEDEENSDSDTETDDSKVDESNKGTDNSGSNTGSNTSKPTSNNQSTSTVATTNTTSTTTIVDTPTPTSADNNQTKSSVKSAAQTKTKADNVEEKVDVNDQESSELSIEANEDSAADSTAEVADTSSIPDEETPTVAQEATGINPIVLAIIAVAAIGAVGAGAVTIKKKKF